MAENKMIYFLAGYIYAQAEQIVKELFPSISNKQFRTEVRRVQSMMIHNLSRERGEDGRYDVIS